MKIFNYEFTKKKVLVTGASGFKGAHLADAAVALGAEVAATIRPEAHPDSAFMQLRLHSKIRTFTVDVSQFDQTHELLSIVKPDIIFHLAAKALVPEGLRHPLRTFQVNIGGTLNILEASRQLHVGDRIVIAATDHVFGSQSHLPGQNWAGYDESQPLGFAGPYDSSKAAMELLVRSYDMTFGHELPRIAITRCANVFGIGDINSRRVIPLFVRACVDDGEIPLRFRFNGRQFLHITDAVAGYLRAAAMLDRQGPRPPAGQIPPDPQRMTPTFHFALESYDGTSEPFITMQALAQQTARLFKARVNDTGAVDYAPNEIPLMALDCSRTKASLGWSAQKSLKQGLLELAEWYVQAGDPKAQRALLATSQKDILAAALA